MSKTKTNTNNVKFGLALSGGGSRAAAFHLGCMRALNDRGILEKVSVISTVSGGSLIGAMWAYSDESFDEFDRRMQSVLRKGLINGIIRYTLFSSETLKIIATAATSGMLAMTCSSIRVLISALRLLGLRSVSLQKLFTVLQAPLPRFASRTTAFSNYLENKFFGSSTLRDVKRKGLNIVINATELRTQSAFRYGSLESGCWRVGKLVDETLVAKAVASSAAFPALLPALDENRRYIKRDGEAIVHRTIISDGGVYDNLGTSCLIPKRDSKISTNVTEVDFIIACVADQGIPDGAALPYFWPSRMYATVNTIHRRTHSMTYNLLHRLKMNGEIQGFLLPYLGQDDNKLPCPPSDLVPKEATSDYPTDFDPMSQEALDLITKRGEQLTRNLIETYYPEL